MKIYLRSLCCTIIVLFGAHSYAEESDFIKAITRGDSQEVARLLRTGADSDTKVEFLAEAPVLLIPILKKDVEIVTLLLENGANPNFKVTLQGEKVTPLHLAIKFKNMPLVKALVESGASFEGIDSHGSKPLHIAASDNQLGIVEYLVSKGAPIDSRDAKDRTPLHWASLFGYQDIVVFLVENGANINAKSVEGYTPLSVAEMKKNFRTIKYLKNAGGK